MGPHFQQPPEGPLTRFYVFMALCCEGTCYVDGRSGVVVWGKRLNPRCSKYPCSGLCAQLSRILAEGTYSGPYSGPKVQSLQFRVLQGCIYMLQNTKAKLACESLQLLSPKHNTDPMPYPSSSLGDVNTGCSLTCCYAQKGYLAATYTALLLPPDVRDCSH